MTKQEIVELTTNKMIVDGYNCAQSMIFGILLSYNQLSEYEYLIDEARILGGGVAGLKQSCGFITGAALAYNRIFENKVEASLHVEKLNNELIRLTNSWQCADITQGLNDKLERRGHCSYILEDLLKYIVLDITK